MIKTVLIPFLLIQLSLSAQVKTVFFNEPFRLALSHSDEWYMQDLNKLEGFYQYGSYEWVHDTLKLYSRNSIELMGQYYLDGILLKEIDASNQHSTTLNKSDLYYRKTDFYKDGMIKQLLLNVTFSNKRKNRYKFTRALFNPNGKLTSVETKRNSLNQ